MRGNGNGGGHGHDGGVDRGDPLDRMAATITNLIEQNERETRAFSRTLTKAITMLDDIWREISKLNARIAAVEARGARPTAGQPSQTDPEADR